MCVCASLQTNTYKVLSKKKWQDSSTLHYYAKIINHPQWQRKYESQKSFQAY